MKIYIKENLKYLRERNELSVLSLSKELEVNDTLIGKIENGVTSAPLITTVIKISNYFKVSLDQFVFEDLRNSKI